MPQAVASTVVHPEWTRNATIYEVNLRQFSPEGTIQAFRAHLPRLQDLGVKILWLMPIHPIGVKNRKGTLGSYYAAQDYKAVSPEFGTLQDLKEMVAEAHERGMYVIIDWVANHTGWDHVWIAEHPEWFKGLAEQQAGSYVYENGDLTEEWVDVIGLDFSKPELWDAMIDCLLYWVKEADIDGYRCDVAGLVPTKFWNRARRELDAIKPVFMLAEWSEPDLHEEAFDMTYDWPLGEILRNLRSKKPKGGIPEIIKTLQADEKTYPTDSYRMKFTTNHDLNSWEGSDEEFYGPAWKAFVALTFVLPGMPLIYSGQEGHLRKRLEFFEKDPIDWGTYENQEFLKEMVALKTNNPALAAGTRGGPLQVLPSTHGNVLAIRRSVEGNTVEAAFNLGSKASDVPGFGKIEPWGYRLAIDGKA